MIFQPKIIKKFSNENMFILSSTREPTPTSVSSTTALPEEDKSAPLTLLDDTEIENQMLPTPDDVFVK